MTCFVSGRGVIMQRITSSEQYFQIIEQQMNELNIQNYPLLLSYFFSIKKDFHECENSNNPETFFKAVSKVIRLDAKLVLLREEIKHLDYFGASQDEIIKLVEQDSRVINKEFCGYRLTESPHTSLIFNT